MDAIVNIKEAWGEITTKWKLQQWSTEKKLARSCVVVEEEEARLTSVIQDNIKLAIGMGLEDVQEEM